MTEDPTTLEALTERLKRLVDRAESVEPGETPQRSSVPIRRHVLGLTDIEDLDQELHDQGYAGERSRRLALSAVREHQLHIAELEADTLEADFRAGNVDGVNLQARYQELGFQPDEARTRAALMIAREGSAEEKATSVGLVFTLPSGATSAAGDPAADTVRPGAPVQATITLVVRDAGTPIASRGITLQRFDPEISDYVDVQNETVRGDGSITFQHRAPERPGDYRYRARYPGNPGEYRSDVSREVRLEVA